MKFCPKCSNEKSLSEFGVRKDRPDGDGGFQPKAYCKPCEAIVTRESYYRRHEKAKEQGRKSQAKQRETNRARVNEIRAQCAKRNKHYENARTSERYHLKKLCMPKWANKKYIELFYLGAQIESERTGKKVHVDHIVPIKNDLVCGLHCEDNLQLLFAEANLAKSNSFEV